MARVEWRSALLLLGFITGAHLSPDVNIEMKGDHATFYFRGDGDIVLYRSNEEGDLLLVNCSQPDRPQPDGYNITCPDETARYFKVRNLMMSHSGLYRAESWRAGNITDNATYHLIVCAESDRSGFVTVLPRIHSSKTAVSHVNRSEVVCKLNGTLGNGTSLQVYRWDSSYGHTLVLDTSSSLEPLVEDLKGILQLDLNRSQVTWHGDAVNYEHSEYLLCTTWRDAQCQSKSRWKDNIFMFAYEEENVTLPCFLNDTHMYNKFPYWITPNGAVRLNLNQTRGQEVMYMLNGSQSEDYSLIIPSVSKNHSGMYMCFGHTPPNLIMYVCPESLPPDVMFFHGESVSMPIAFNGTPSSVHWYRKKALQSEELIVDCYYRGDVFLDVPEELRGRVSLNRHCYSLNISNLREEDSALYSWRVFQLWPTRCYQGSIRLVYRDPFGVDSPFYRAYGSVLGAVLLGLVAAVIWVNLRSRRGQQTSGPQRRKRKQSGDEDPNDDVEEAEDLYDVVEEAEDLYDVVEEAEDSNDVVEEAEDLYDDVGEAEDRV